MPFGNTHNQLKMKFSSEQEYPDLSKHNNHMAKVQIGLSCTCLHAQNIQTQVPVALGMTL